MRKMEECNERAAEPTRLRPVPPHPRLPGLGAARMRGRGAQSALLEAMEGARSRTDARAGRPARTVRARKSARNGQKCPLSRFFPTPSAPSPQPSGRNPCSASRDGTGRPSRAGERPRKRAFLSISGGFPCKTAASGPSPPEAPGALPEGAAPTHPRPAALHPDFASASILSTEAPKNRRLGSMGRHARSRPPHPPGVSPPEKQHRGWVNRANIFALSLLRSSMPPAPPPPSGRRGTGLPRRVPA